MTTPASPLPSLDEVKTHLNIEITDKTYDAELQRMLNAAVEIVSTDPDFPLVPSALTDGAAHPALHLALMEFVRDMWTGTQLGGGGRSFGQDGETDPGFTAGRPVMPPYVRGLLGPYRLRRASPHFSFPPPLPWPG